MAITKRSTIFLLHLFTVSIATESFHFDQQFQSKLDSIGELDAEAFLKAHSLPNYLDAVSYDVTTSKYYDLIAADIHTINNQNARAGMYHAWRTVDGRLNKDQMDKFKKNGFVVCESKSYDSFGEAFYRIYSDDLPVFVTADALLHAWHFSFDKILEKTETEILGYKLVSLLNGLKKEIRSHLVSEKSEIMMSAAKDADLFVTVVLKLLKPLAQEYDLKVDGQLIFPDNSARLDELMEAVEKKKMIQMEMLGSQRIYDFSQFTPRGHYTQSEALRSYFQGMTWLGRTEIILAGDGSSDHQVAVAALFHHLLKMGDLKQLWKEFDKVLQTFVGISDSMTFDHLEILVDKAGVPFPFTDEDIIKLKSIIEESDFGQQAIASQPIFAQPHGKPKSLPQVFQLMGQKFTLDSFALGKVVYDRIMYKGEKVLRTHPTGLDVAYATLGNDHIAPDLAARDKDIPYFHNLMSMRKVTDELDPQVWKQSIYTQWLAVLRELSIPTTSSEYPEAMRTHAWAMKDTTTQMASWTQLRHDTILYTKESYGAMITCEYPSAFVDPRPNFWRKFEEMASSTADMIDSLDLPQFYKAHYGSFLRRFAATLYKLKIIAEKELKREPMLPEETQWLKEVVNKHNMGSGQPTYSGWYCQLFITSAEDSCKQECIVADVHTQPPDDTGAGHVLHEGVGDINLMIVSVNSGDDKAVYVGPVFSYYEFEEQGLTRLTDEQWTERVTSGKLPARSSWTKSYLSTDNH